MYADKAPEGSGEWAFWRAVDDGEKVRKANWKSYHYRFWCPEVGEFMLRGEDYSLNISSKDWEGDNWEIYVGEKEK